MTVEWTFAYWIYDRNCKIQPKNLNICSLLVLSSARLHLGGREEREGGESNLNEKVT